MANSRLFGVPGRFSAAGALRTVMQDSLSALDDQIFDQANALESIVGQQNTLNARSAYQNLSFEMGVQNLGENLDLGLQRLDADFSRSLQTLDHNLESLDLKYGEQLADYDRQIGDVQASRGLDIQALNANEQLALFRAQKQGKDYESQYRLTSQGLANLGPLKSALRRRASVYEKESLTRDLFTNYQKNIVETGLNYQQLSRQVSATFSGGNLSGLFQGFDAFGVQAQLEDAAKLGKYYEALSLQQARRSQIDAQLAVSLEQVDARRRLLQIQRDAASRRADPSEIAKEQDLIRQQYSIRKRDVSLKAAQLTKKLESRAFYARRGRALDRLGKVLETSFALTRNTISRAEQLTSYRQKRAKSLADIRHQNTISLFQGQDLSRQRAAAERDLRRSEGLRERVRNINTDAILREAEERGGY